MKNPKILPILLIVAVVAGCSKPSTDTVMEENNLDALRNELLTKYKFERTRFDTSVVALLSGNKELGGLVNHDGLGIDELWSAAFWKKPHKRVPLYGPSVRNEKLDYEKISNYHQSLSIKDGLLKTKVEFENAPGYETEMFFSVSNPNLLVLQLKDLGEEGSQRSWDLQIPMNNSEYTSWWPLYTRHETGEAIFTIKRVNKNQVSGQTKESFLSPTSYQLYCSTPLSETNRDDIYSFTTNGGDSVQIYFTVGSGWYGKDHQWVAENSVPINTNYNLLLKAHQLAWKKDWEEMAVISLPDKKYESLLYRSLFWMLCTSGSEKFLPAECQFGNSTWWMIPFSYGSAGWSAKAYAMLGHHELAQKMAVEHFKPTALVKNAAPYIEKYDRENKQAFSFAHMIDIDGVSRHGKCCDRQRHIDAFIPAMFHILANYSDDNEFMLQYTYPVFRGAAEFWKSIAHWNDTIEAYTYKDLLSVSETLERNSLLDIMLSAKWELMMAARYADKLGVDKELSKEWKHISENIFIPENEEIYLQFRGDKSKLEGGGYIGIRGHVYLGYPNREIIPYMDKEKVANTFDLNFQRNNEGKDMIAFVTNWMGLTELYYKRPDKAMQYLENNFNCMDPSNTTICEDSTGINPYFNTNYSSYVISIVSMLVQSYNLEIDAFPAVPTAWQNVEFYNLAAENGVKVSGKMENGEVKWVTYQKNGKKLLETKEAVKIKIEVDDDGNTKLIRQL
ncbi:MAG: hypothetical protein GVY19_09280 [Bacteroidetes bacterium]|nr:hypothetical protein [Bacteroidota bacterium]